ncbi:MAG: cell division protein FtsZ [Gammaproteobacteria bacterium]|nr:cell division protein FtsZ [Gammaproteobacteria bacterium]
MTFEYYESTEAGPVIKVLGLGGGGGNAVEFMVTHGIEGVEFLCANTDVQALNSKNCDRKIQIGRQATRGLGAGANPELGKQAATEDHEVLADHLVGTDMLFLTAGMGGGTGTGSIPVVAKIARDMGILTVGVVTMPFSFEGPKRCSIADQGTMDLAACVDALIVIPNDNVLKLSNGARVTDSFAMSNDVLRSAVQGIAELVTKPGLINVDFADVRTVMQSTGRAMMGTATATGEERAAEAAMAAINSPLLGSIDVHSAKGVLVNISGGEDLRLDEIGIVGNVINQFTSEQTNVVIGTAVDPSMNDSISVTVVVAGIDSEARAQPARGLPTGYQQPQAYSAPKPYTLPPMPQVTREVPPSVAPQYRAPAYAAPAEPTYRAPAYVKPAAPEPQPEPAQHSPQKPRLSPVGAATAVAVDQDQDDWMSIPTFLRRQSD